VKCDKVIVEHGGARSAVCLTHDTTYDLNRSQSDGFQGCCREWNRSYRLRRRSAA
jgi:hypothetical protein